MPQPPEPSRDASERSPLLGAVADAENGAVVAAAEDDEPQAEELSTAKLVGIMSSIWLGTFLAALDSTLVATLATPISSSFDSLSLLSWLASGYFIATAALQPLSGKLTDIYGRRAGLVVSNVLFCAGNLLCGLAQAEWQMVAGRVVAGAGGGGLNAISTFVASDLIPLRRRGVWQGFGNIMYGVGSALGGVFGGAIHGWLGWRWAFYIQVPMSAASCVIVYMTLNIPVKDTGTGRIRRVDFLGAVTLVTSLVLLLLGLNSGGNTVPWDHPLVLTTLPLSAVLFAAFIHVEANVAAEPIIPVRVMMNRTVMAACLTNWFTTMAQFCLIFYAPIYFQLRGASPTEAGLRLAPQSVGIMVGSLATGFVMRVAGRYWYLSLVVMVLACLSYGSMLACTQDSPRWPELISLLGAGLGYAGMLTVTLIALISAVEHRFQAVVTSASYAFRSTGSSIGVSIGSAVFQNALRSELWARIGTLPDAKAIIRSVTDSFDEVLALPPVLRAEVEGAYMLALRGVFGAMLGLGLLGLFVSLFMREHKLHTNLARRD